MYSYRHAFHAGSHADVLKHMTLAAIMGHMVQKDAAITVVDTHAGAGLYRLDGDYAGTSGEAAEGVIKLAAAAGALENIAPLVREYLDLVASFNRGGAIRI